MTVGNEKADAAPTGRRVEARDLLDIFGLCQ